MNTAIEEIINRGEKDRENLLSVNLLALVRRHIEEILNGDNFLDAGEVLLELSILVRLKSELLLLLFAIQPQKRERKITEEEDILDVFAAIRRTFKQESEQFKHRYVEREEIHEVPVSKLEKIVREILEREKLLETKTVKKSQYSIKKAIAEIKALLDEKGELLFQSLFEKKHSKIEIILMFLAILILAKNKKVIIYQENLFAPIYVKRNNSASARGGSENGGSSLQVAKGGKSENAEQSNQTKSVRQELHNKKRSREK